MTCLHCGHYILPDREMAREQRSDDCRCDCHQRAREKLEREKNPQVIDLMDALKKSLNKE